MAALSTYFIPQVLHDINVFKVGSPTELNSKLVALQRAAAAALVGYLYMRYPVPLPDQLTKTYVGVLSCVALGSFCLATPTHLLEFGGVVIYRGMVNITAGAKDRDITYLALGLLELVGGCFICNNYQEPFIAPFIPNTIDKLFVKIANKYTQRVWKCFYEK